MLGIIRYVKSFVGGGSGNLLLGGYSFIGGGGTNRAYGLLSTVVGGEFNSAYGNSSFVGGGQRNSATTLHSSVVGGTMNIGDRALVINLGLDNSVDAKTINIGSSGDSVNIYGNTTYV